MNAEQRRERAALLREVADDCHAAAQAYLSDDMRSQEWCSQESEKAKARAVAVDAIAAEYETNDPATWSPAMAAWAVSQLRALGEILGIRDTMTDAEALQHVRDVVARAGASR